MQKKVKLIVLMLALSSHYAVAQTGKNLFKLDQYLTSYEQQVDSNKRQQQRKKRESKKFKYKKNTKNDFIKLDNDGNNIINKSYLASCIYDKNNGLFWEVKTQNSGARDYRNQYPWSKNNQQKNNWYRLIKQANKEKLCGYTDWTVPNKNQLKSLSSYYANNSNYTTQVKYANALYLNPAYFPTTPLIEFPTYWSRSQHAKQHRLAWQLNFYTGRDKTVLKDKKSYVRLVRGGNK